MSTKGKNYNQYLQTSENDALSQKINDFMQFLDEIGLITNKSDSFIIKRRYKMLLKDVSGKIL